MAGSAVLGRDPVPAESVLVKVHQYRSEPVLVRFKDTLESTLVDTEVDTGGTQIHRQIVELHSSEDTMQSNTRNDIPGVIVLKRRLRAFDVAAKLTDLG